MDSVTPKLCMLEQPGWHNGNSLGFAPLNICGEV